MEFSFLLIVKLFLSFTLFSGAAEGHAEIAEISQQVNPSAFPTGHYIDFSGDIGGTTAIHASLFVFADHTVKGSYFYDYRGQEDQGKKPFYRMNLEGVIDEDGKVDLKETDLGGRHLGQFVGQFGTDEGAELSFTGTHHDLFGGEDRNFYLAGDVQEGLTEYDNRYAISGTQLHDNEVEFFAHRVQTTLLNRDAEQFMKMVEFPVRWVTGPGKAKKIKNEAQLREKFSDIFNEAARETLLNATYYMLSADMEGICLAGLVYFRPNKKKGLSIYKLVQS